MNVPRPLLVVVLVIIVLGVVSCGVGVIRGRVENGDPTPAPTARFSGFGDTPVPPGDVRAGAGCTRSDPLITVAGSCVLTIDPQSLRPRSLVLRVTSGSVDI